GPPAAPSAAPAAGDQASAAAGPARSGGSRPRAGAQASRSGGRRRSAAAGTVWSWDVQYQKFGTATGNGSLYRPANGSSRRRPASAIAATRFGLGVRPAPQSSTAGPGPALKRGHGASRSSPMGGARDRARRFRTPPRARARLSIGRDPDVRPRGSAGSAGLD